MKARRSGKDNHVFYLGKREKELLFSALKLYPLVPASHHRLNSGKESSEANENQRLLEESLAEHRKENQRQVLAMLKDQQRLRETDAGFELTLTPMQMEWLLQVLNDVRVGSWLALGEPEPGAEPEVTAENSKYFLAMELCGAFESVLLAALGIRESRDWMGSQE